MKKGISRPLHNPICGQIRAFFAGFGFFANRLYSLAYVRFAKNRPGFEIIEFAPQSGLCNGLLLILLPWLLFAVPDAPGRPYRPPYVSGDAFRWYSDYAYDEVDKSLDPASVKPSGVVFVKTDFLGEFFEEIHPRIPVRYILIAHNSDAPTPGPFAKYLDDEKLIAWFGQNFDGQAHPKMHPIPMGIANSCWQHGNVDMLEQARLEKRGKKYLAHMQFTIQTNSEERMPVYRQFSAAPFCSKPPKKPFRLYLADIGAAMFEIAPRGNALDTHRIWESLYMGTIPVVRTSSLDGLYADLPILIIERWKNVTGEFLEEKYDEFSREEFYLDKLDIDYWTKLIDSYKET